ncbi:MAG: hypothetical protein WBF73_34705, partial [Bradyrhizobium sp.]
MRCRTGTHASPERYRGPVQRRNTALRLCCTAPGARGGTALLEVKNLVKHFVAERSLLGRPKGFIKAVDGVSFSVDAGKTLALVGES